MRRPPLLAAVALALLTLGGCKRWSYESTLSFEKNDNFRKVTVDAPRSEQKVTVTATSTKEPINVFVVLAEDEKEGEQAADRRIKPEKALGGQANAKEISFEATIPAKKEFIVFVCTANGPGRETEVKLSVKER
jgi:hypothetical protein